jgi:GLPGLI family protein
MKRLYLLFVFLAITCLAYTQQPKVVGECTITYSIKIANGPGDATKRLFIKGKQTRSEIVSPSFIQTTIYNEKTGEAVILRQLNGENYISKYNANKWKEKNKEWDGMTVKQTNESKIILGYPCKKAITTTKAGKNFVLYYTNSLAPSANENPYQFKNIPGIVMEYESETSEGKSIIFRATKIDFSPVPAAKFEIPKSDYRLL